MIGGPTVKYPRRINVLTCTARDIISISNRLEHFSQSADHIADSSNGFAPALSKIQNFVAYHRKTKMNNSDDMDELEKMIWAKAYTGQEDIARAFSVSIKKRTDEKLLVGEGGTDRNTAIRFFNTEISGFSTE
ncbi:hypothetical protein PHMEG_00012589 [Phytophthora megakarya]|uniref:Uncharacterized protein n=1 Tax=Phytophthora megakarya TaxID=4795 RepID=A0A225W8D4_9STRA|nr:hypothetical protein PHMEG_00012589 [Phytophthora megakarya]